MREVGPSGNDLRVQCLSSVAATYVFLWVGGLGTRKVILNRSSLGIDLIQPP